MNNILKIIEIFMGMATARASGFLEDTQGIPKKLVNNIRQLVIILVVTLGSLALFCIGVTIAVTNLLKQLDETNTFTWTATFTGGVIVLALTLIAMFICLREKTWMKASGFARVEREDEPLPPPTASPLEEAVGMLIKDFVMERENNRQNHVSKNNNEDK